MDIIDNGFTLIEVLVAIAVISIGILAMQIMQGASIEANGKANRISIKSMMASSKIEEILNLAYDDPLLDDSDLDGTDQDINADGLDDRDDNNINTTGIHEEFGLRQSQCCPGGVDPRGNVVPGCVAVADQCHQYEDFEIYWNVAVDYPVTNTKTITIIVIDAADRRNQAANQVNQSVNRAEYTYIKDDAI